MCFFKEHGQLVVESREFLALLNFRDDGQRMFKLAAFGDVVGRVGHDCKVVVLVGPTRIFLDGVEQQFFHVGFQFFIERLDELGANFEGNGERSGGVLFLFHCAVLQNAWGESTFAPRDADAFVGVGSCSSLVIGRRFGGVHL